MKDALYYQLSEIQKTHWWHVSRRYMVTELLKRYFPKKCLLGLDVGCGPAGNLSVLKLFCENVIGFDLSQTALKIAKKEFPLENFILGDANKLVDSFVSTKFGLATVFNVLYHNWINDEVAVLRQIYQLLEPGGRIVVTEPACKFLMRRHDVLDMGKTRYSLNGLKHMLVKSGFVVEVATYFNFFSFLPVLLLKFIERFLPVGVDSDDERVKEIELPPKWINDFMVSVLKTETGLTKLFGGLPIGLGVMIIARKPQ